MFFRYALLLSVLCFFINKKTKAQQCSEEWAVQISGLPNGNVASIYPRVCSDKLGNIVFSASLYSTDSISIDTEIFYEPNAVGANTNMILSKISFTGDLIWAKIIVGTGSNHILNIVTDSANNIYVVGYMGQSIKIDSIVYSRSTGQQGYFIAKFSELGYLQWIKYPQYSYSRAPRIAINKQNVYCGISYSDSTSFGGQTFYVPKGSDSDLLLVKTDTAGNYIKALHFDGAGGVAITALKCNDIGCLIQGVFDLELCYKNTCLNTPAKGQWSMFQLFVSHTDSLLWYNVSTNASGFTSGSYPDGLYFTPGYAALSCGTFEQASFSIDGISSGSPQGKDAFIIKTGIDSGDVIWIKKFNGVSNDVSKEIISYGNNAVVCGSFNSSQLSYQSFVLQNSPDTNFDGFILSVDENGMPRCGMEINGMGNTGVLSIAKPNYKTTVALIGFSGTVDFAGQTYTAKGNSDLLLIKTCLPCDSAGNPEAVHEPKQEEVYWQVYPNPNNGSFELRILNDALMPEKHEVSIYNATGQQVYRMPIKNTATELSLTALAPGFYFVKLGNTVQKMVISY
jgi:hypothetical protein